MDEKKRFLKDIINGALSYSEADRIYKEGFPSFEQLMESIKQRFNLSSEECVEFDAALKRLNEEQKDSGSD